MLQGLPFPNQEENAIDCVMKFAIDKLGFPENRIILNGWSIGGYTASWAAMNYPYIHSLVRHLIFKFNIQEAIYHLLIFIFVIILSSCH
jgi:hypothetical protein